MKKYRSAPTKKRFGQHWLIDKNILSKIVEAAELKPSDTVLEIGTGTGFLTQALAASARAVTSFDIDEKIQQVASENLAEYQNVSLVLQDILTVEKPFSAIVGSNRLKVVSNIPYNITTPIIELLIRNKQCLDLAVLMVQKEFGYRLAAEPGTKDYSSLSLFVQYYFKTEIIWKVSKTCFQPPPKVESVIVRFIPHQTPPVKLEDEALFFGMIRASFWGRRKTLRNTLLKHPEFRLSAAVADRLLAAINIPVLERGENLGMSDFAALANKLFEFQNKGMLNL
ncbi:16S rRNA (adenine(1518)-N(6)/adenine(1519)-N(6))-dimethyltransferase RsmA [Candidatus Margulisiibacteriota bacterium]